MLQEPPVNISKILGYDIMRWGMRLKEVNYALSNKATH